MPIKKGSIVNNSYNFQHILILIPYSCCAVVQYDHLIVENMQFLSIEGSDKASVEPIVHET